MQTSLGPAPEPCDQRVFLIPTMDLREAILIEVEESHEECYSLRLWLWCMIGTFGSIPGVFIAHFMPH